MECDICQNNWDKNIHIPRILNCGHSFCEKCLENLIKKRNKTFLCPICKLEIKNLKNLNDIKLLNKNETLLKLFDKIENNNNNINNNSNFMSMSFSLNENNLFNSEEIKNSNNFFPLCETHKIKADFFINNNNKKIFYCEDCIKYFNIKNFEIVPNLKEQNLFKINASFYKIEMINNEIKRIENFLENYQKNFEIQNLEKIEELFNYLKKIINYNYTTVKTLYMQCKNEQRNQINKKKKELISLKNELKSFKENLISINNNNFNINNQIELNKIFHKLANYLNYNNELNLFQMKLEIKTELKDTLFDLIQNSYDISIDFLKMKNGKMPTLKELLNKEINWCCECGIFDNKNGNFICNGCSKYRKLESYNNIIFNPFKITQNEIKELNIRRKHEIRVFQNLLNKNVNLNNNVFYALDKKWFLKWKCFVTNDLRDKYIKNNEKFISENKLIGVLPPEKINNYKISVKNKNGNFVLKENMKLSEDYLIINSFLWEWFLLNYEGEPEVVIICDKNNNFGIGNYSSGKGLIDDNINFIKKESNRPSFISLDNNDNNNNIINENNNNVIIENNNNNIIKNNENKDVNNTEENFEIECNENNNNNNNNNNNKNINSISFDPNGTLLQDTIHRINPIQNYNFNTKLSNFNSNNSNFEKDSK